MKKFVTSTAIGCMFSIFASPDHVDCDKIVKVQQIGHDTWRVTQVSNLVPLDSDPALLHKGLQAVGLTPDQLKTILLRNK